ncbi:MAG: hypothetical protein HOM41_02745 [Flavobacteriales bacterium]|jgi:hypothetical protein|nr:hypothetical protein [Flavobacteriales bacterium]MBT6174492.1 hypothetical protein [Flavobacteriales bacterium]MBT7652169.1 hypothetical protein [Flavobacteriales bacterium]
MSKSKFHWGHGITLALIFFAILMGYLAYSALMSPSFLVREDYYKAELEYSSSMDAEVNGHKLTLPSLEWDGDVLTAKYPENYESLIISPEIEIYCPSNPKSDIKEAVKWSEMGLHLHIENPPRGLAYVIISWEMDDEPAFHRVPFHFPL